MKLEIEVESQFLLGEPTLIRNTLGLVHSQCQVDDMQDMILHLLGPQKRNRVTRPILNDRGARMIEITLRSTYFPGSVIATAFLLHRRDRYFVEEQTHDGVDITFSAASYRAKCPARRNNGTIA